MLIAIIGDLIGSKRIEAGERYNVQEKLKRLLEIINSDYSQYIKSNFAITLGDEFQGLLHAAWPSIPIIKLLARELFPHGVRFGIGFGEIYTEINPEKAVGADGPAYHRARDGIEHLKTANSMGYLSMNYNTGNNDAMLINAICDSLSDITREWTDKQCEAVRVTEAHNGSQKSAAKELGINKSSVTRHLKSANFTGYRHLLDTLEQYFRLQYDSNEQDSPDNCTRGIDIGAEKKRLGILL